MAGSRDVTSATIFETVAGSPTASSSSRSVWIRSGSADTEPGTGAVTRAASATVMRDERVSAVSQVSSAPAPAPASASASAPVAVPVVWRVRWSPRRSR